MHLMLRVKIMRSTAIVSNPLLGLPAAQKLKDLPPEVKSALYDLLKELAASARERAEKSWHKGKAPMAVYWKAVSVYANHTARICRQ